MDPSSISLRIRFSFSRQSIARFAYSAALSLGRTITPSSSPTIQSPGKIRTPPTTTGTFSSPKPFGSPACETTCRAKAGNSSRLISTVSRIAPSITMPWSPLWIEECVASSPQIAGGELPASTTITSPGAAWSMASTGLAQSPGAVRTV